ncbi:hypothetical protein THAOC_27424, partial [Thalassiosira oceanica]
MTAMKSPMPIRSCVGGADPGPLSSPSGPKGTRGLVYPPNIRRRSELPRITAYYCPPGAQTVGAGWLALRCHRRSTFSHSSGKALHETT